MTDHSNQPGLFDWLDPAPAPAPVRTVAPHNPAPPAPPRPARRTSSPEPKKIAKRVYDAAMAHGWWGAIGEQLAMELHLEVKTVSSAISKLKHDGWLRTDGRERRTSSGCLAAVLVAVRAEDRVPGTPQHSVRKRRYMRPKPLDGDITANYHGGNEQSRKAFQSLRYSRVTKTNRLIMDTIRRLGTATNYELSLALPHIRWQTLTARTAGLKFEGFIRETGEFRKTASGRDSAVLVVVDK